MEYKIKAIEEHLKKISSQRCVGEDDDCYRMGVDDGYVHLAQELLAMFFKKENQ